MKSAPIDAHSNGGTFSMSTLPGIIKKITTFGSSVPVNCDYY